MKQNNFKDTYRDLEYIARKVYVFAACAYSLFWLFREIFFRHGTDFEAYLL